MDYSGFVVQQLHWRWFPLGFGSCLAGSVLAVVGGRWLRLWCTRSAKLLAKTTVSGSDGISGVAWTPDGTALLLASNETGSLLQVWYPPFASNSCIADQWRVLNRPLTWTRHRIHP